MRPMVSEWCRGETEVVRPAGAHEQLARGLTDLPLWQRQSPAEPLRIRVRNSSTASKVSSGTP